MSKLETLRNILASSSLQKTHDRDIELVQAKFREISLREVANHDSSKDCWIIVYDRVYDITSFFNEHPGGCDVLLEYAGRDATLAFRGTGHSKFAENALDKLFVGQLPLHERIYLKAEGYKFSNIPE